MSQNETVTVKRKKWDSTVSFVFSGEWVDVYDELETYEEKHRLFKAIANYSMYDEEPDFSDNKVLQIVWTAIVGGIDASLANRKKWFDNEEANASHVRIKAILQRNPEASLQQIADEAGVSRSTVHRVKRKLFTEGIIKADAANNVSLNPDTNFNPNSEHSPNYNLNHSSNHSHNHNMERNSGTVPFHTAESGHSEEVANDAVPSLDNNRVDGIIDEATKDISFGNYTGANYDEKQYQSVKDVLQCDPSLYESPRQIENETGIDIDIVMMICSRLDKEGFIRICRERVKENAAAAKYAAARAAQVDDVDCIDDEETGPIYNDTDDIPDEDLPF